MPVQMKILVATLMCVALVAAAPSGNAPVGQATLLGTVDAHYGLSNYHIGLKTDDDSASRSAESITTDGMTEDEAAHGGELVHVPWCVCVCVCV